MGPCPMDPRPRCFHGRPLLVCLISKRATHPGAHHASRGLIMLDWGWDACSMHMPQCAALILTLLAILTLDCVLYRNPDPAKLTLDCVLHRNPDPAKLTLDCVLYRNPDPAKLIALALTLISTLTLTPTLKLTFTSKKDYLTPTLTLFRTLFLTLPPPTHANRTTFTYEQAQGICRVEHAQGVGKGHGQGAWVRSVGKGHG